jgi:branched-subunit amino acid transport protein
MALPEWAQRGLQYAPIAALSAVIAPDILLTEGELGNLLRDARTWGALAAAAYYFWRRRGGSFVLPVASIGVGMAVYLPLRLLFNL